jgi:hypothetical protein
LRVMMKQFLADLWQEWRRRSAVLLKADGRLASAATDSVPAQAGEEGSVHGVKAIKALAPPQSNPAQAGRRRTISGVQATIPLASADDMGSGHAVKAVDEVAPGRGSDKLVASRLMLGPRPSAR